jgi:hypothetical protein
LKGNNSKVVIPGRRHRKKEIVYDKEDYKKRGEIERVFGKNGAACKQTELSTTAAESQSESTQSSEPGISV